MCKKCKELDEKIAHFRQFNFAALDPLTIDRIKDSVADLQRERDTMHQSPAE